jgi:two-component system response regulator YesN
LARLTPVWIEQIIRATTTLLEETLHPRPDGAAYRLSVLMQFWAGLHRFALAQGDLEKLTETGLARVSEIVDEAKRYVRRHLTEDLSLERVSEQVDISREYLTRCFRTETGVSFRQYVIRQRLLRARRLLAETDHTVTAVCFDAGFGSLSHFIRTFKRTFGRTPSAYRRTVNRGM